jgi:hypothetical protein
VRNPRHAPRRHARPSLPLEDPLPSMTPAPPQTPKSVTVPAARRGTG